MADYNSAYTGAAIDAAIAKVGGIEAGATNISSIDDISDVAISEVANGEVLTWSTASSAWTNIESVGISNIVEDTTPQLGGNLDLNGKAIPLAYNAQTGTTYTAVLTDADKIISMNNASANTLTIPANTSVAYPVGTKLNIMQLGAGATTVAITTDTLNVNANFTLVLNGQYAMATAVKVTSTTWVLTGNLVGA